MLNWRRWGVVPNDALLAICLGLAAMLEAALHHANFPPATLLAATPLAWRRRWPMAALPLSFAGAAVAPSAPFVELTIGAVAAYSVGAHEVRRWLGAIELGLIAVAVFAVFGGGLPRIPDFIGPVIVLAPTWLIGSLIRVDRLRGEALAERAARLERESELVAMAAQADERARLARELHDVLAHSVSLMVVQSGASRHAMATNPSAAMEALRVLEATGHNAMAELRQLLGVLGTDEALTRQPQPGLTDLMALVEKVREAGLPVQVIVRGLPRGLSPGVELTAYRTVQEALTNALKHSGMAATKVALEYGADELKVEILSEGPISALAGGGRGLEGMEQRAALLGGRVEAGPSVDGGYDVRAWLPIAPTPK